MSGDWIKMECATPDKPEVLALTVKMGWDDPDLTVGKLFKLWRWFDQHTTEGNAAGVTPALLDRYFGVSGFVTALTQVGWLVVTDDGVSLPNFDRHNGASAKQRSLTAKRVANHKSNAKGNANTVTQSVTAPLPREEKRREEKKNTNNTKSATPPFVLPSWINQGHWETWHSTAKRKKATPAQKQMAVDKLAAWRDAGEDFAGALENAAIGGNQGLFLPSKPFSKTSTGETPYQKSMRERMSEFAPGIARRAPGQEFTDLESINVVAITRN